LRQQLYDVLRVAVAIEDNLRRKNNNSHVDNSADGLQLCARTADHRKPTGASTPPEHWGGGRRSSAEDARGCAPSQKIYEFFISKRCDIMQMKMTATCGIQKFRRREKNKTLVKILGVVNTGRPLQVKYWGVATPATLAALTPTETQRGMFK